MAERTATVDVPDDSIVTIEVEGDAGETTATTSTTPPPAAVTTTPTAADEAAARMQAAVDAEKRRREAAEATANSERQRADEASRREQQSRQAAEEALAAAGNSEMLLVTQGLDSATKALATAKAAYKAAFDAGEGDKMADAQEQIAIAASDIKDYGRQKAALEAGATTRRPATHEGRVEPTSTLSPMEQYLQGGGFSPQAQTWLRSHPECLPTSFRLQDGRTIHIPEGNAEKNKAMMRGHHAAMAQDVTLNSPEYFQIIEENSGYRSPTSTAAVTTAAGEATPKPAKVTPRTPPVAAPVTNEPPVPNGVVTTRRSVQLTPQQQEIAMLAAPPQKPTESDADFRKRAFGAYARELVTATAEGKIGRMTH